MDAKIPLEIVLLQPEIPNNTGNIGRTAAATGAHLHIVHPIGFQMDEKARRRAGLDYWEHISCREHDSWQAYLAREQPPRAWLFTARTGRPHWEARFAPGDHLIFGKESAGVDDDTMADFVSRFGPDSVLTLPMVSKKGVRSLNLATAVAVAAYEALRQVGLPSPESG